MYTWYTGLIVYHYPRAHPFTWLVLAGGAGRLVRLRVTTAIPMEEGKTHDHREMLVLVVLGGRVGH